MNKLFTLNSLGHF